MPDNAETGAAQTGPLAHRAMRVTWRRRGKRFSLQAQIDRQKRLNELDQAAGRAAAVTATTAQRQEWVLLSDTPFRGHVIPT
jgi:hypothetical protein